MGPAQSVGTGTRSHNGKSRCTEKPTRPVKPSVSQLTFPPVTVCRPVNGVLDLFRYLLPDMSIWHSQKAYGLSLRGLSDLQFLILSPLESSSDWWTSFFLSCALESPLEDLNRGGSEGTLAQPTRRLMALGSLCRTSVDLLAS